MSRATPLFVLVLLCGCIGGGAEVTTTTTLTGAHQDATTTTLNPPITTFFDNKGLICRVDGKPLVRMYSNTECWHCAWSGPIFDKVAKEYADGGLIIAHHWVFDRNDDTLTNETEGVIPDGEYRVFLENNQTTVPYFNFGCRFTRTGNGYMVRDRPDLEEAEYRAVIDQLILD